MYIEKHLFVAGMYFSDRMYRIETTFFRKFITSFIFLALYTTNTTVEYYQSKKLITFCSIYSVVVRFYLKVFFKEAGDLAQNFLNVKA